MRNTENGVITTLEFGIDNISVEFGGHIYQQLALYFNKAMPITCIDILGLYFCTNHTK